MLRLHACRRLDYRRIRPWRRRNQADLETVRIAQTESRAAVSEAAHAGLALDRGGPAELLYAGAAPDLIGYLQINARVPGGLIPPGLAAVALEVGSYTAPPFAIWLQ